jgi:glycosyltransferase involved in cell wall biosynthesis
MNNPKISVILPTFNGEKTIRKSINSILEQTYENFELIIINDGSTDGTVDIINSISDQRIKLLTQKNYGLPKALNTGISMAVGEYIARQDQDDISYAHRFSQQIVLLEQNANIILVGTWARIIDNSNKKIGEHKHPITPYGIKTALLIRNPVVHSSVMFRKNVLLKSGLYDTSNNLQPPEDYELWCRLINYGDFINIPEFLVDYFHNPNGLSKLMANKIQSNMHKILYRNFKDYKFLDQSKLKNLIQFLYPIHTTDLRIKKIYFFHTVRLLRYNRQTNKLDEKLEFYLEVIRIFLLYFKAKFKIGKF